MLLNEVGKRMNRQISKTKNVIFDALLKKMRDKPYHEITIVEITEEADVARLSFYRHFNSKEDIILFKFKDVISKIVRKISVNSINSPKEILDLILSIIDGYKSIFNVIIKQNLYGLIVQSFSSDIRLITKKITRLEDSDVHLLTFYEGALVNLIIDWISSKNELSKDEYLNIVDNIFKKQLLCLNSN
jgi:AcrR family transcriptional regulator